jgi:hypothetical protein
MRRLGLVLALALATTAPGVGHAACQWMRVGVTVSADSEETRARVAEMVEGALGTLPEVELVAPHDARQLVSIVVREIVEEEIGERVGYAVSWVGASKLGYRWALESHWLDTVSEAGLEPALHRRVVRFDDEMLELARVLCRQE